MSEQIMTGVDRYILTSSKQLRLIRADLLIHLNFKGIDLTDIQSDIRTGGKHKLTLIRFGVNKDKASNRELLMWN